MDAEGRTTPGLYSLSQAFHIILSLIFTRPETGHRHVLIELMLSRIGIRTYFCISHDNAHTILKRGIGHAQVWHLY